MSKWSDYDKKLEEYSKSIKKDFEQADYIFSKIGRHDLDLIEDIYDSTLIRMCIKYEAFTSEAYKKLFNKKEISYNMPWNYTRKIAKKIKINIHKEYQDAHLGWEIYNSLKHVNSSTQRKSKKTEIFLKLKNGRERAKYMRDVLIALMTKLRVN